MRERILVPNGGVCQHSRMDVAKSTHKTRHTAPTRGGEDAASILRVRSRNSPSFRPNVQESQFRTAILAPNLDQFSVEPSSTRHFVLGTCYQQHDSIPTRILLARVSALSVSLFYSRIELRDTLLKCTACRSVFREIAAKRTVQHGQVRKHAGGEKV